MADSEGSGDGDSSSAGTECIPADHDNSPPHRTLVSSQDPSQDTLPAASPLPVVVDDDGAAVTGLDPDDVCV